MAFPSSPINGQSATRFNRNYQYNSAIGVWRVVSVEDPTGNSDPGWDIEYMDALTYAGVDHEVNLTALAGDSETWHAFAFSPDGTIAFAYAGSANNIYKIPLRQAWDLTTSVSSEVVSFNHSADNYDNGKDLYFKPDGTEMYLFTADSSTNIRIIQYSMSTPWDITTCSLTGVSDSMHTITGSSPTSMSFKSDGTTVFVLHQANDEVGEWNMTTAWDITTLTYASNSLSTTAMEPAPTSIDMSDDGTKLFVVGTTNDVLIQYNLSTPYDLSTADSGHVITSLSPRFTTTTQMKFGDSGKRLFLFYGLIVGRFDMTSGYEPNIKVNTTALVPYLPSTTSPQALYVTNDGTKLFIGSDGDEVDSFVMTTPHDVSTLTYVASWTDTDNLAAASTPMDQLFFNTSGTVMYISKSAYLLQYNLSTAWDITTATLDIKSGTGFNGYYGLSADGTKGIRLDTANKMYNINISTAGDIVRTGVNWGMREIKTSFGLNAASFEEMSFHPDGTKFYTNMNNDPYWYLHQWSMSTPWDVTTARHTGKWELYGNNQAVNNCMWVTQGYVYVVQGYGSTEGAVYQYKISSV